MRSKIPKVAGNLLNSDWHLGVIALLVLAIYIYYTVTFIFLTPYPGIEITAVADGWQVNDSQRANLGVEDVIVQIGDLTFDAYQSDRTRVPFANYAPGEEVPIILRSGEAISLTISQPSWLVRLRRSIFALWFFPFWLVGTTVLLFLRPRDLTWRLLVVFMYLISVWIVTGTISTWRVSGSRLVLGATMWLFVPVILHLHLLVPSAIFTRFRRYMLPVLYTICTGLAISEFFQVLPAAWPLFFQALAIVISACLLLYRAFSSKTTSSGLLSIRLMLLGIVLSFGPGLSLFVLPRILNIDVPTSTLILSISLIAIPILPLFYVYAIYKRQLGQLEFRANRLLATYGFALIYPPLFLISFLLGGQTLRTASTRTVYYLFISIAFVLAAPPLLARFQKFVNRLAYGTQHNPEEIIQRFANQIPGALQRDALVDLLEDEVTAVLLIRQAQLLVLEDDQVQVWYQTGVSGEQTPTNFQLQALLTTNGRYIPFHQETQPNWVRLAIPLKTRNVLTGIWLFGRRDPDDYYPQPDINLLQTIANQTATIIENIRLYEALQLHAQNLAAEVANRTAELAAERDRTRAILDSAGEGIFFIDNRGFILYTNPSVTRLTGYNNDEISGETIRAWYSHESDQINETLWTAILNGQAWGGEIVLRHKDGTSFDANLTLSPLKMGGGQFTGFVGVMSDISKLKEIDRLKSNLIAHVSHELKTPLTNINLYLSLIERAKSEEKRAHYMHVLSSETHRLNHLIQDLLDLSRLEAGTVSMELAAVDIQKVATRILETNQERAEKKNISLTLEPTPQLPLVWGDENHLEQLLTNLVVNAINYTPDGGRVRIHAEFVENSSTSNVTICVTDNGYGISAEEIPHLFERFYRGEIGHNNNIPGTGLGLAICKEIVERHQGKIDVKSTLGKGTTFKVWLKTA